MSRKRYQEIRNLFLVFLTAIVCAALLTLFMISSYGPSGNYIAGSALYNPHLIEKTRNENKGKAHQKPQLGFDRIEFTYFDSKTRKVERRLISPSVYQKFYTLVAHEKSVDASERLPQLFTSSPPVFLTLTMNKGQEEFKILQVIQFIQEDVFRVQLHEEKREMEEWAYFSHPGIYQEIIKLFSSE